MPAIESVAGADRVDHLHLLRHHRDLVLAAVADSTLAAMRDDDQLRAAVQPVADDILMRAGLAEPVQILVRQP